MAGLEDDEPRAWWQTVSGLTTAVTFVLALLILLVVSLDRSGFYEPGRGVESEEEHGSSAGGAHVEAPAHAPISASTHAGGEYGIPRSAAGHVSSGAHTPELSSEAVANRITGNYQGFQVNTSGYSEGMSFTLQMSLSHRGEQIMGNYSNGTGDSGSMTGAVHGASLEARLESGMLPGAYCVLKADIREEGLLLEGTLRCSQGHESRFQLRRI